MKRNLQEEVDTFQEFLNEWGAKHLAPEYAQKQQVSCGVETVPEDQRGSGAHIVLGGVPALQPKLSGPAGIHLVPEPPAIPEEPEWSDSDTAREQFNNITGRS